MKKNLLLLILCLTSLTAMSQNVQVHYDFGHTLYGELNGRPNVTTTIETFKPDRWGSTYLFADFDYFTDGAAGAYWEISREIGLTKDNRWAFHAEYDGGMTSIEHSSIASRFRHAVLLGGAWNWVSQDFRHNFSLQALYKYYFKGMGVGAMNGYQITAVWGNTFAKGLCTFSGFVDVWYDKTVNGNLIVLSEPQFWVNLNALPNMKDVNLSIGSEVELSNNFVFDNKGQNNHFYAIPTLALKWTF